MNKETLPQQDDPAYRDYLLDIVLAKFIISPGEDISNPSGISPGNTREQALYDLNKKFKQDFTTNDNTIIMFHTVAIEIMKRILSGDLNYIFPPVTPDDVNNLKDNNIYPNTYLEELINLSKMTVESLSLTYRFDFSRSVFEQTTLVRENILTMQSYLRDIKSQNPSPNFFLYKDEWRAMSNPFYPENQYSIKKGFFSTIEDQNKAIKLRKNYVFGNYDKNELELFDSMIAINDHLLNGHSNFSNKKFDLAMKNYNDADMLIINFMRIKNIDNSSDDYRNNNIVFDSFIKVFTDRGEDDIVKNILELYDDRRSFIVNSKDTLKQFENKNVVIVNDLENLNSQFISLLLHFKYFLLPICKADIELARGNFSEAAELYGRVSKENLYRTFQNTSDKDRLEELGDLPYYWNKYRYVKFPEYRYLNQTCEINFMQLRLGNLYLAWADSLYLSDHESDIFRARELYKDLLLMYGIDPLPNEGLVQNKSQFKLSSENNDQSNQSRTVLTNRPNFSTAIPGIQQNTQKITNSTSVATDSISDKLPDHIDQLINVNRLFSNNNASRVFNSIILSGISPLELLDLIERQYYEYSFNPLIVAQQTRALLGIFKIDSGLNFLGYRNDVIPMLRYKILMIQAQKYAVLAEQAEHDFISFTHSAEEAELNFMNLKTAAQISGLRMQIEDNQIKIAKDNINQVKIQINQITEALERKRQEIEDHSSTCGQVKDFFQGAATFISKIPGKAFELGGIGLGIGLIGAAEIYSLNGMADAGNKRVSEQQQLESSLEATKHSLDARNNELLIAQTEKTIASLYAMAIQSEINFSSLRFLNFEMYARMSNVMNIIMHRYIELGISTAWLAERALCYTQDRDLRLIRFDYFNVQNKGVLAADQFQSDLALLEAENLNGFKQSIPIKYTISLSRDFPLQFGQLKKKGECSFFTSTSLLNLAYPGCFAQRIKALEIVVISPVKKIPVRGILTNYGYSKVDEVKINSFHNIVRPFDAFPLSEFKMKDDMFIYELPGESLMPFEGSGFETMWDLKLPAAANIDGLSDLADVIITFSLNCQFSHDRQIELSKTETNLTRSVIVSAKKLNPDSMDIFCTNPGNSTFEFIITNEMFSDIETNREITNLAVFFIGKKLKNLKASLFSDGKRVDFTTDDGLAHSNKTSQPLNYSIPPSELDPLASGKPERSWKVTLNSTLEENSIVEDILLGIEYKSKLQYV